MSATVPRPSRASRGRGPSGAGARVALSTTSVYPYTCAEAFGFAADLGYDGVEVMVWTDPVSQDADALLRLGERHGLPVLAVHAPTLLVAQRVWGPEPWSKIERSCEHAVRLGARVVVVHPPFRWQREYARDFAEGIVDAAERHGVVLAVENMYPWRVGRRELEAYTPGWDPLPQPYPQVTLDLSHCATSGTSGLDQARLLGDRLAHLHLGDGSGSGKDEHLVPGRGEQPCAEVLSLLARRRWRGTVAVEVNTRRARDRAACEADLAESLAFARRHLTPTRARATGPR
jgi:sugar phosphate isomerase/epimerase